MQKEGKSGTQCSWRHLCTYEPLSGIDGFLCISAKLKQPLRRRNHGSFELVSHDRDLCFLNAELLSRQMSLPLICFIRFTGFAGWAGFASCPHVLLNQAQFALGSLRLIPSLLFTFLSAELTPLFYINGNLLGLFQQHWLIFHVVPKR